MRMMFFFIGGLGPKTIVLDDPPRPCPSCGRTSCRLTRTDHYLSLFFIPLFRVKKGEPVRACRECGAFCGENRANSFPPVDGEHPAVCRTCGRPLEPDYVFCPKCGFKV
ncbi:MAG: zinc ribbon domain-containing protein [Candidatus Aminicenantes bacterium]|nr:zinc ribbon domain-containing protein [Candidatus Aminicenantes bacterium]